MKMDYRKYLITLGISVALAFLMLYVAFGLIFFTQHGNPLPPPFSLLLFAISFVLCTVFYRSREPSPGLRVLLKAMFLAICTTFIALAVTGGLIFTVAGEIPDTGVIISALALFMVVSVVLLTLKGH